MNGNDSSPKQSLLVAGCLLAISGTGVWIYFTQFAKPDINETLHVGIGRAMAEETSKLLGHKGQIVIVAMETAKARELKVQLEEFGRSLKRLGSVGIKRTISLETEDKPKYGSGSGLSGRRFLRIVKKTGKADADAIVSFVGVPTLTDDELARLDLSKLPKFIAEVRSAEKLKPLFEKKIIQVAIVSRFEFPAPGTHQPRTPEEWFQNRFQIVTAENAKALLAESALP